MKRQDKQLPDPNGPLSSIIHEAIRDANDAYTLQQIDLPDWPGMGSLLHDSSSPTTATQISLYLWYPLTMHSFNRK